MGMYHGIQHTYGVGAVEQGFFGTDVSLAFGRGAPKKTDAFLRVGQIYNLAMMILGYIPGVSTISGVVRMGVGLSFMLACLGVRVFSSSAPSHILDKCVYTAFWQVVRGFFEAAGPIGYITTAFLDAKVTTVYCLLNQGIQVY